MSAILDVLEGQYELGLRVSNGNGKMGGHGATQAALSLHADPRLSQAIEWLRQGDDYGRHMPGCQCRRCIEARTVARSAVATTDCQCGWCPRCWVAAQIAAGRL
jgi:hypothetical protein